MRTTHISPLLVVGASALAVDALALQPPLSPSAVEEGRNVVILELNEPSLTQFHQIFRKAHQRPPNQGEQQRQLDRILQEQASVISALSDQFEVVSQLSRAVNGIKVFATDESALEPLESVHSRHQVGIYSQSMALSSPWIGANQLHDFGIYGDGVRIGVVDTGIDYSHIALGGDGGIGVPNDPGTIETGSFPNAKVVGGIDLAGDGFDPFSEDPGLRVPRPDPDPFDRRGHGTHVAATVAGLGVSGVFAPGIAPGAELYAIKIFGDGPGTSTFLQEEAIDWALDPNQDGDLSDHLDILNLSLGGDFGAVRADNSIAIQRAVDFGVIVVAAAGNSGIDVPYVVAAPSVASGAISVAANHTGNQRYVPMILQTETGTSQMQAWAANSGHTLEGTISGEAYFPALDGSQPCAPDPLSIENKIVFLSLRDGCSSLGEAYNSFLGGAEAVVFYNNADYTYVGGYSDFFVDTTTPFFAIREDLALAQGMHVSIELDAQSFGRPDNPLATFSSAGPKNGVFKPDLSAPGVNIHSAEAGSAFWGVNLSGTSMAAPHVAGAAALVKELHPELSVAQVKAMLMNYTTPLTYGNGSYVETSLQGLGELNLSRVLTADTVAFPAGLSFGTLDLREFVRVERTLSIKNMSSESRLYRVSHRENQTFPGMHFSYPTSVWVPAASEQSVVVAIHMNPFEMQNIELPPILEFDGWFSISSDSSLPSRVGYQAIVRPVSTVNSRRESGKIVHYNDSQRSTPISGYHVLPDLTEDPPALGLQFGFNLEKTEAPLLHAALSFEQPWDSVSTEIVAVQLYVDEDATPDFTAIISNNTPTTPYLSVRLFAGPEGRGEALFEGQVEAGYNSRLMRFSLPWSIDWTDGFIAVTAFAENGVESTVSYFSNILDLPELPRMHVLKPYTSKSVSFPDATLWYVPGADVRNQSVIIPEM